MKIKNLALGIAFCSLLAGRCSPPAQAQTMYAVSVNTTALSGQSGYLDLQFNPGGLDALDATVQISSVVTDGTLDAMATDTGDAMGSLPGPPLVTIGNLTSYNDLFQGFTFGNSLTFDLVFSGVALNPPLPQPSSGSTFALSLYAADQITPLLTTDASGAVLLLQVNPDGSTSAQNFPSDANGGAPVATAMTPTTSVPEPGIIAMFIGLGSAGLLICLRRVYKN